MGKKMGYNLKLGYKITEISEIPEEEMREADERLKEVLEEMGMDI